LRLLLKTQIFSEQFVPRQSSQNHVLTGGGIAHSVSAASDLNNLKLGSNILKLLLASRVCRNIIDWLGSPKHSFPVMLLAKR
jgi:hypothetical protein